MPGDIDEKLLRKYITRLKKISQDSDIEGAHSDADTVLTDILSALGYDKLVKAYNAIPKWYA